MSLWILEVNKCIMNGILELVLPESKGELGIVIGVDSELVATSTTSCSTTSILALEQSLFDSLIDCSQIK